MCLLCVVFTVWLYTSYVLELTIYVVKNKDINASPGFPYIHLIASMVIFSHIITTVGI